MVHYLHFWKFLKIIRLSFDIVSLQTQPNTKAKNKNHYAYAFLERKKFFVAFELALSEKQALEGIGGGGGGGGGGCDADEVKLVCDNLLGSVFALAYKFFINLVLSSKWSWLWAGGLLNEQLSFKFCSERFPINSMVSMVADILGLVSSFIDFSMLDK